MWDTDGYECAFAFARSTVRVDERALTGLNDFFYTEPGGLRRARARNGFFRSSVARRRSIGSWMRLFFNRFDSRGVHRRVRRVDRRLTVGFDYICSLARQTVPTCSPCCSNRNINVFTAPADAKDPTKLDLAKTTQKLEVLHGVANRADQAGMPNRVLVYCMSGQSRAPSVAVAYLMRSERRRLDDAMSALARRYPRGHRGITLKPGDYEHLEAFERELFPDG